MCLCNVAGFPDSWDAGEIVCTVESIAIACCSAQKKKQAPVRKLHGDSCNHVGKRWQKFRLILQTFTLLNVILTNQAHLLASR